ncbi:hypothetical protein ACTA71_012662 [Dictyostelium dimigraforme]
MSFLKQSIILVFLFFIFLNIIFLYNHSNNNNKNNDDSNGNNKPIYLDFKSIPIELNENEKMIKEVVMSRECQYIDLVYTWVNGSDPKHTEALKDRVNDSSIEVRQERFRDVGTLKYSLRSVRQFAPWINNIFIITSDQIPTWFNTKNPDNVKFIFHRDYFHKSKSDLPTFNSNSIESNFWNLPVEVSNCFLYLNDDIFFSRPVKQSDYFDENFNQVIFAKPELVGGGPGGPNTDEYTMAVFSTNRALSSIWNESQDVSRYFPAHGAQVFNRKILYKMQEEFGTGLEITSSSYLRNFTDFQMAHLYNQFALKYSNYKTFQTDVDVIYFSITNENFQEVLSGVNKSRSEINTICLNDGLDFMNDDLQKLFDDTFNNFYPIISPYEN